MLAAAPSGGSTPVRHAPPKKGTVRPVVLAVYHPPARRAPAPRPRRPKPAAPNLTIYNELKLAKTRPVPKAKPAAPPYVNPFGPGVIGGRTDQGVDYTGRPGSPIYAPGAGRISIATTTSGWPGGGFIAEQLSQGPAKGKTVYFAEDVQPSGVAAGSTVRAGQPIGKFNQGGWIEAGWGATGQGDTALAQQAGQSSGYVPVGAGAYSTAFGVAFGQWVKRLRGPGPGSIYSRIVGSAPPWASNPGGAGPQPGGPAAPPSVTMPGPPSRTPGTFTRIIPSVPLAGPTRRPIAAPRRGASARPLRAATGIRSRGGTSNDQRPPTLGPVSVPPVTAPRISPVPDASTPTAASGRRTVTSLLSGGSSAGGFTAAGGGTGVAGPGGTGPGPAAGKYDWLIVLGLVALLLYLAHKQLKRGK